MRKLIVTLALVGPGLAFAAQKTPPAPPQGNAPAAAPDDGVRWEHMQKRMRLARTLGLAEALDLDDAAAMKARDVLVKYDDKAAPLRKQLRDGEHVLRDAAHGDAAAAGQVDAALKKLADARAQLQRLDAEVLQQLTQGMAPEKKARAALFLAHFGRRAGHPGMMMENGPTRGGPGMGPGMGGHRGPGPGMQGRMYGPAGGPGGGPGSGPGSGPMMAGAGPGADPDDDGPAFGDDD